MLKYHKYITNMWGCYLSGVIVRGGLSVYKLNTYGNGVCYKITTTINVKSAQTSPARSARHQLFYPSAGRVSTLIVLRL